jgi:hypothetical protein
MYQLKKLASNEMGISFPKLEMNDEAIVIFLRYSLSLNFLEDIAEYRKCLRWHPVLLPGFEWQSPWKQVSPSSAYANLLDRGESDFVWEVWTERYQINSVLIYSS